MNLDGLLNDLTSSRHSKQKRLKHAKPTGLFLPYKTQISRSQLVSSSDYQPRRRQITPSHSRQFSVTPHSWQTHRPRASNTMVDDSVGPRVNNYGGLDEDEDGAKRDFVLEIHKGDRTTSNSQVRIYLCRYSYIDYSPRSV